VSALTRSSGAWAGGAARASRALRLLPLFGRILALDRKFV
jgi:hypothetical protein